MASFAEIDTDNVVIRVVSVNNDVLLDEEGNESEQKGIDFLELLLGTKNWVQTSYNKNFRGKFAGIGDIYDKENDRFTNLKPFDSWILDEINFVWAPPVPFPNDYEYLYTWDEENLNWKQVGQIE
jgi:hypothetical protein